MMAWRDLLLMGERHGARYRLAAKQFYCLRSAAQLAPLHAQQIFSGEPFGMT